MSISSSDLSKQALHSMSLRPEQHTSNEFTARKQLESKVVQALSDTNRVGTDKPQSQSVSPELEPSQVESMNSKMAQLNVRLSFETTEDGGRNIVKVVDQSSGDVVRQIPTEDFLKMSERIDDIISELSDVKGTLVNSRV
ncbi:flagellar protein FlaG [Marinomonas pollencensis]|uniref:Flagellar protein FlaG n=1 Tax=Marinomonas pollencensis TaxID=491954 RepID=A0A3E0DTN5_9GAMM|nr:flagellar protein FlaG [Marinomonas pollencensis]REG84848.1 flagellar protein FlaG [Marinomonas pollencensis]